MCAKPTPVASGVFDALPRAPTCELGVEEMEGAYGRPTYEERGRENML